MNPRAWLLQDHAFFVYDVYYAQTTEPESRIAMATLKAIIEVLEKIAPTHLAEEWDNVGLQVGQLDQPIRRIWVALDPSLPVVSEACSKRMDLLITHHPLIFPALKAIDFSTPVGAVIQTAVQSRLAIFSAHTNLDRAVNGVNDILARRIGLKNVRGLGNASGTDLYKLVLFVPAEYEQQVLSAVFETRARKTGDYLSRAFRHAGTGTLRASADDTSSEPSPDGLLDFEEARIETLADKDDIAAVIDRIQAGRPGLKMTYDVFPLWPREDKQGLGRVGELEESMPLDRFAEMVKHKLQLPSLTVAGKRDLTVKKVALCSGSGGSLIDRFLISKADVFVSGDLRYHDAREAESRNLGLIDVGHFASEHIVVEELAVRLQNIFSGRQMDVTVEACKLEKDPFYTV